MIIVKLISGLGNQLFQYAIGRQLSITNKVPLKLDTSFFKDQNLRSYKLDHYNINAEIASEEEVAKFLNIYKKKNLAARIYRGIERRMPKQRSRYFKENEWWVYEPELLKVSGTAYIEGYWQHYKYFENINPEITRELTLKDWYDLQLQKMVAEISNNSSSVSLHIRRGDYISDPKAGSFMGVLPLEYYNKAIRYISQHLKDPSYYIFSDELDWVKDNLKSDAPMQFVDVEGGNKDYIELDMMSRCSHNVIANSSFSWWGAFLNRNPDKIVIAPDKWVIPPDINTRIQLQFPSWVKL